jgi:hypothetical protein
METVLIQLTTPRTMKLLQELEELHLLRVLKRNVSVKTKLSDKYKGFISKEDGQDLNEHIKQMRSEWNGF